MTRNARGDWRDAPIDVKVKPLVDALNATGVVETYASCQGHALRRSDPYVAFRCGVDVAARLDKTLHGLLLGNRLRHRWDISASFHPVGWELRFCLRAPALTEARHDPARAFWFYILRRKAIDHDLDLLSRELCGDLGGGGGAGRRESQRAERPVARRIADAALQPLSLIPYPLSLIPYPLWVMPRSLRASPAVPVFSRPAPPVARLYRRPSRAGRKRRIGGGVAYSDGKGANR